MEYEVGSIVWVRRRNGSWWPGQIVDPDDLSASHLNLPRSGTPVKLLGREDASVDWYNLEKSKRVKAFRCGEFDDCIERVESTHGMPLKKREKYARREDAILHALELEKQILKEQGFASRLSNNVKKGIVTPPETLRNDKEKRANSKSLVLYENEITGGLLPSHIAHDGNKFREELDHTEETPQMRGFQDFGLTIAPLKGKLSSSVDPNISQKLIADDGAQALASGAVWAGSALHIDGAGQVGIACRAKRSRYVYLPAESSDSLDYRETLTCVDMSSSQIGGECPYRGSMVGETKSAFMDDAESDSTETDSTVFDSDSSETEADMDEEMTLSEPDGDAEEHESTSSDEPDEQTISSNMPYLYPRELVTRGEAVSKWQLKGKRNNRNLLKRSVGAPDRKGVIYGAEADTEGRSRHLSHKRMGSSLHCYRNDFGDALDDDDQMFGLEDEYSLNSGAVSKSRNRIHVDWDDWAWDDHLPSRGYWDIKRSTPIYGDHYCFGGRMNSMLINVDLKVQAGYRKEPVPFVSLNSKLDGKAIIGHPIQVETLKDGSSDILFSAIDDFNNDGIGINGNSVLPPAWSTARRTANFRTPRPHVSSSNGADVAAEFPSDQERNFEYKQINAGSSSHKANLLRKSGFKGHQSSTDKRPFKKVPKKASLSSSQKTRTLSSLSIEHNLSRKPVYDSSCYQTDRLIIKPEISGPTTVACIPVQLVFSRLLEKINRPPLKATSNAALLNIGVERNS